MKAWEEITTPLDLPIGGKTYRIPEPSMDEGLLLLSVLNGQGGEEWVGKPLSELFRLALGDTWEQMRTDGVPLAAMDRAGWTALTDLQQGRAAAELMWENGPDPEVLAALPAALPSTTSTSTESENGTRSPASTPPTTSPTGTPPKAVRKATTRRRPGPNSSTASS